ncbi:MAG: GntR family transcriptional regulator, partial [Acidobacteriota bacterium]|nr:GntR family transcriptional regulator [Acidobacteriota bacterium]
MCLPAREDRQRSGITLYEKTIDFVRQLIAENSLVPGDRLPSEVEIAAMAGVSLMTVRRAMSELVAAGTLQ